MATAPKGVNPAGQIVGFYVGSDKIAHGFLRKSDGSFVLFDPQGSTGTFPLAINARGEIVGRFSDASGVSHGFARLRNGRIASFDPPGSISTTAGSVNIAGEIVGSYEPGSEAKSRVQGNASCFGQPVSGFLRAKDGTIVSFNAFGSPVTEPAGVNRAGNITGSYLDDSCVLHGFLREP
jgi:hypothetical protein